MLALGGALFLGVVAVSALLFTIIPRFQLENSFFLDRWMTKKSLTGFSETIRLSDVIDIQQDNTVALRVDVSDPARIPVVPYWRMVVLDEYRGGIFSTSRRLRDEMTIGAQMRPSLQGTLPAPRGEPEVWTFYLEAGISRYLPLAGPFHLLRFREPQWVYQQYSLSMIALRNEPVTMTAYRVEGMPTSGFIPDRLFGATLRNIQRAQAENRPARRVTDERGPLRVTYPLTTLQLPDRADDRQTLQRAVAEITGGAKLSAEEFAAKASGWLRARHGYALQVTLTEGERDPVVVWLESSQAGHCELFTAAFTLLARTAGFPTRAITGFKGGDWNAYENYFMVRNSHAHAWCEVYDGTAGWFRVDPTAGTSAMAVGQQTLTGGAAITRPSDRSWQARIDAIRILWYRRIVSFDQRTQLALVQSVRETAGSIGAAIRGVLDDAVGSAGRWLRRPWGMRRSLGWLGLVAAAGLTAAWWWRRVPAWWWRVRGLRRRGGADPVRREAGRLLRRIAERSLARGEGAEVLHRLGALALRPARHLAGAAGRVSPRPPGAAVGPPERRSGPGRRRARGLSFLPPRLQHRLGHGRGLPAAPKVLARRLAFDGDGDRDPGIIDRGEADKPRDVDGAVLGPDLGGAGLAGNLQAGDALRCHLGENLGGAVRGAALHAVEERGILRRGEADGLGVLGGAVGIVQQRRLGGGFAAGDRGDHARHLQGGHGDETLADGHVGGVPGEPGLARGPAVSTRGRESACGWSRRAARCPSAGRGESGGPRRPSDRGRSSVRKSRKRRRSFARRPR